MSHPQLDFNHIPPSSLLGGLPKLVRGRGKEVSWGKDGNPLQGLLKEGIGRGGGKGRMLGEPSPKVRSNCGLTALPLQNF